MSDLQIKKVLVLSANHIRRETARDLVNASLEWAPVEHDNGWMFVTASVIGAVDEADSKDDRPPEDLVAVARVAEREDCTWFVLDMDGARADELAEYAW